jgi:hypothetical protein
MQNMAVDLVGPFEVEAVDGSKYLLMVWDAASSYCFVKPIKAKSNSNKVIMDTIICLERIIARNLGIFSQQKQLAQNVHCFIQMA